MERYDIAIIGTGPAGLSAAITAVIRKKRVVLFGSRSLSDKVEKAHTIQNYLGLPSISGQNLQKAFLRHLDEMQIAVTEERVTLVYPMGDYFALQTATNAMYEAESVILATGVVQGKPYAGEEQFLGRGVSYCATCDAPLYRGKTTAVIASNPKEEAEAEFLAEYAEKVYYFPQYDGEVHVADGIEVVHDKPVSVCGDTQVGTLETEQGSYAVDGVFILREAVAPGQLLPGLQTEGGHVKVDRALQTNVPGCFACGDLTGRPYQYIKSAGEGNVAALSAAAYLDGKRRAHKA